MKTRKLKRLGITAVLAVLMMSFAITAMATQDTFRHNVNTTSTSSGRYYNMHKGPVYLEAQMKIVNQGVPDESYTAKVGNVKLSKSANNTVYQTSGSLNSTGRTYLGVNRITDGTTLYGYVKAINTY